MNRGDLFLASAGSGYVGKPRPVLIVQDDALATLHSVVVCPLSSSSEASEPFRIPVEPSEHTGLDVECVVMVDKVSAVPRSKIGPRLGRVDRATLRTVSRGLATVIGLGQPV